ncbi:MAG: glutamine amidotransferase [Oscillospiraceae bacterium]|nr:glutamine amidotransferase [Oscillospiraceae bacterium]
MTVKILSLYRNLTNLYGSDANIRCLKKHIEEAGNACEVTYLELGQAPNFSQYDFVYMGAATERSQKRVLRELMQYKNELLDYVQNGGICLFCGNSFELLGKSITTLDGTVYEALDFYDFETVETKRRVVVDTICDCRLVPEKIVGFMNKQSRTTIVTNPLFRVVSGAGNAPDRNDEGICDKNLFATELSGPILVRNPHFRAMLEKKIYEKKGINALPLYFMYEEQAYKESLKGLGAK